MLGRFFLDSWQETYTYIWRVFEFSIPVRHSRKPNCLQTHSLFLFEFAGVNPSLVGLFRGLCALMGFAATFLSASMISKLGVLKVLLLSLFVINY
jgi:hypothetical protein